MKWIVGIILLGLLLRIIALQTFPSGFTPDEASFGYDAYSLLKTGKDQWGTPFPLVLKSFGDYKAPLFSYILIPFVAVGGLTKEIVRLPNAIIGTLAILATYLFVLEFFKRKSLALISAFLLSISSWHIMMSRGGFEANLTTFFLPLGLYFLLKGLKENRFLYLGALTLGLNLFTYHSAKVITPLVILLFLILYRKEILKINRAKLFLSGLILSIFGILTLYTFTLGAGTRAQDINIFNGTLQEASVLYHQAQNIGLNPYLAKTIYNKYTIGLKKFIGNYLSYFSPQFLFTNGPAEATYGMIPGRGVLYWFELPFIFMSVVSFIKARDKKAYILIIGWLLLAPITASLATGPGYAANRAEGMLPALLIILGLGFIEIPWKKLKLFTYAYAFFSFVIFILFLEDYFIVSPIKTAPSMLYGNYEIAQYLSKNFKSSIVVDKDLSEPHIYIAFATKFDPASYQNTTKSWILGNGINWVDQIPDYNLGNYEFKTVHLQEYLNKTGIILVAKSQDFPSTIKPIYSISYPNSVSALSVVKTQ